MAARLGAPLRIEVKVLWDPEAKAFVATSEDLLPAFGIVAEAETRDGIKKELFGVLADAEETVFGKIRKAPAIVPVLSFA